MKYTNNTQFHTLKKFKRSEIIKKYFTNEISCLRRDPNTTLLMCRTELNKVRLWSSFGATADSNGVLASNLIREVRGKQFVIRKYAF